LYPSRNGSFPTEKISLVLRSDHAQEVEEAIHMELWHFQFRSWDGSLSIVLSTYKIVISKQQKIDFILEALRE